MKNDFWVEKGRGRGLNILLVNFRENLLIFLDWNMDISIAGKEDFWAVEFKHLCDLNFITQF